MMEHDEARAAAIQRLKRRREVRGHLLVYAVVNTLLIVVWAASGAGYFWPIWPIAGWGVGLALHAWSIYGQRPITEDEIIAETRRERGAA
ncbi:MAG: 2TM domain-containing protein [Actinomycetota bacterium]